MNRLSLKQETERINVVRTIFMKEFHYDRNNDIWSIPGFAGLAQVGIQDLVQEIRLMAAINYFQEKKLSLGKAADLAGCHRISFMDILAQKGIVIFDYDESIVERVRVHFCCWRRSPSHIFITDWCDTTRRVASLSSESIIQTGKSTLTRFCSSLGRRALEKSRSSIMLSPLSNFFSNSDVVVFI